MDLMTFGMAVALLAFIVFGGAMMVMKFYRKVEQGKGQRPGSRRASAAVERGAPGELVDHRGGLSVVAVAAQVVRAKGI